MLTLHLVYFEYNLIEAQEWHKLLKTIRIVLVLVKSVESQYTITIVLESSSLCFMAKIKIDQSVQIA